MKGDVPRAGRAPDPDAVPAKTDSVVAEFQVHYRNYLDAKGALIGTPPAFANDPDSGMWHRTADILSFSCGGTTSMEISTGGAYAASFNSSSGRAIKRETGKPSRPRDILARLRPIMYRLLAGGDHEQLGLIAEEVHEVCPQLSDGKSVAYDRLAILLLAAWQDEHLEAA